MSSDSGLSLPAVLGRARRTRPPRPFEAASAALLPAVVGCDEVGRGALCGPVVVAAVWFDPGRLPRDLLARLDDSKRLAEAEREALAPLIRRHGLWSLAAGSRVVIDRDNIRAATLAAMARAVERLGLRAPVRVDGRDVPPGLSRRCEAVVGGDSLVPQIAAASILAKTVRDGLMRRLARRHPAYGWERNVGYGTAAHLGAMTRHGLTPHHRRSFVSRAVSSG